jgi:hypothetical protein
MIDDAETKMRTEASVLFELKTSVPFCHALQIFELIYFMFIFIWREADKSLYNVGHSNPNP